MIIAVNRKDELISCDPDGNIRSWANEAEARDFLLAVGDTQEQVDSYDYVEVDEVPTFD